ncbi:MAG: DUF4249 domain-containing protein [Bacteroidota bacterium]|nr:DUF4249 domain-containing protein [Bacteroidota bacterium]
MYRSFVFFAIVLLLGLTACEKVIDLDFGTTSSQLVIQGTVFDQPGPYTVRLIRSVDMDAAGVYPFVTGATVTISDNAGHSEQLAEGDSGRYTTSTLRGVPGRTYTLTVKTGGKTYTAVSTMPAPIEIDTAYVGMLYNTDFYQVTVDLKDPSPDSTNYFRFVDFNNGKELGGSYFVIGNDYLNSKPIVHCTLQYTPDMLTHGGAYTVWVESIDETSYTYFNTFNLNNEDSASPSNPETNLSNEALGYFNACAVRKVTVTIP